MFDHSTLLQGWRSLWEFRPNPGAPLAARLLAATLLAVALALGLMSLVAVFGRVNVPGWWWISLLPNIGICLCIVHTLFAVLRVAGQRLPPSLVGRMADVRDLRATRESVSATVQAAPDDRSDDRKSLVCTLEAGDFRVIAAGATATGGTLRLKAAELRALQCDAGRTIRVLDMASPQPMHQIGAAA